MPETDTMQPIAAKIHAVTKGIEGRIPKLGKNTQQRYDYATAEDIITTVRAVLVEHGVVLLASCQQVTHEEIGKTRQGATMRLTTAYIQYTLIDVDTGTSITLAMPGTGTDTGDKGLYKAVTGSLKYFLRDTFQLAFGDDPEQDSDEATTDTAIGDADAATLKTEIEQAKRTVAQVCEWGSVETLADLTQSQAAQVRRALAKPPKDNGAQADR